MSQSSCFNIPDGVTGARHPSQLFRRQGLTILSKPALSLQSYSEFIEQLRYLDQNFLPYYDLYFSSSLSFFNIPLQSPKCPVMAPSSRHVTNNELELILY